MEQIKVKVQALPHYQGLQLPQYQSAAAAGMDLLAAVEKPLVLQPQQWQAIPCGIALELPQGYEAQVRPRSGLALKSGITVLNAPGTIDADYRGEIKAILINHSKIAFTIERGMRIAQLVVAAVCQAELFVANELAESERGAGGFGSSGV